MYEIGIYMFIGSTGGLYTHTDVCTHIHMMILDDK